MRGRFEERLRASIRRRSSNHELEKQVFLFVVLLFVLVGFFFITRKRKRKAFELFLLEFEKVQTATVKLIRQDTIVLCLFLASSRKIGK